MGRRDDEIEWTLAVIVGLLLWLIVFGSCSTRAATPFETNCASCHGMDAKGAFGPGIRKSSKELVTSKTQKGQYPKGYKPKRDTAFMPIIALTAAEINSIVEYLNK